MLMAECCIRFAVLPFFPLPSIKSPAAPHGRAGVSGDLHILRCTTTDAATFRPDARNWRRNPTQKVKDRTVAIPKIEVVLVSVLPFTF
jgi:hypothetical protein